MKLLLILLVVLLGIWLWRANRHTDATKNRQDAKTAPPPLDMVRCTLCAVHVPVADAVQGKKGAYCSVAHRHRAEP